MSDFNMPPGVSSNDIPGNRSEDREEEVFWTLLDKMLVDEHGESGNRWLSWNEDLDPEDLLWEYVKLARDIGYNKGYQDGGRDEQMARGIDD
jgi:hypothetical protein